MVELFAGSVKENVAEGSDELGEDTPSENNKREISQEGRHRETRQSKVKEILEYPKVMMKTTSQAATEYLRCIVRIVELGPDVR